MIRLFDAPRARDASMNSRSLSASTWPRTTRATPIQPNRASSKIDEPDRGALADDRLEPRDLAEHVARDEQGDEEREGQEDVRDPHQHVVEEPAADPGPRADRPCRPARR